MYINYNSILQALANNSTKPKNQLKTLYFPIQSDEINSAKPQLNAGINTSDKNNIQEEPLTGTTVQPNFTPGISKPKMKLASPLEPGPVDSTEGSIETESGGNDYGGLIGAGLGILQAYLNNQDYGERNIRQPEVNEALAQNLQNRGEIKSLSPESVQRARQLGLERILSSAMAGGANAGAGLAAKSGLGGEVNSAVVSGIKAAPVVAQSTAPYAEAISQSLNDMQTAQFQKQNLLQQNTQQRGQMAYDYTDVKENPNPYAGMLNMAMAGMNSYSNAKDLTKKTSLKVRKN